MKMILLFLTCPNDQEAEKIARTLLEKKLVVCTKRSCVNSMYYWKRSIESDDEVLLIMESEASKFSQIEKEVKKLHSYEQFVLLGIPVLHTNAGVSEWMQEGLS